jgi:hypothetical protein
MDDGVYPDAAKHCRKIAATGAEKGKGKAGLIARLCLFLWLVVSRDPLSNRPLQTRPFILALQFPESRLGEVSEIRSLPLFATRGRFDPNDLS